jgi:hypothetical protein
MKHLLLLIICGVALLLYPVHSRAEPYTLSYSLVDPCHKTPKGSRAPKRPLVVDLVGHTLAVPSQLVGYTLTLESEDGKVYTYYIIDATLSGEYKITISDRNSKYEGIIFINK